MSLSLSSKIAAVLTVLLITGCKSAPVREKNTEPFLLRPSLFYNLPLDPSITVSVLNEKQELGRIFYQTQSPLRRYKESEFYEFWQGFTGEHQGSNIIIRYERSSKSLKGTGTTRSYVEYRYAVFTQHTAGGLLVKLCPKVKVSYVDEASEDFKRRYLDIVEPDASVIKEILANPNIRFTLASPLSVTETKQWLGANLKGGRPGGYLLALEDATAHLSIGSGANGAEINVTFSDYRPESGKIDFSAWVEEVRKGINELLING